MFFTLYGPKKLALLVGLFYTLSDADGTTEAPTVKLMKSSIFSYEQAWHRYKTN
ncbi:hypothetical protein CK203_021520 [Vitis vinifera]|uniref:Uncharacterized protein n=1 Tax=Vitis vinifera TaxID=29760 RepID=A0A438ISM2_VITVI|nr:hypothetical protein CK203_021520 [Vitis vinifera]